MRPNIKSYVGSGFVIDPSGLIVTDYHVVENAFEITVVFYDGTRLPATTWRASRLADLAILKVEAGRPLLAAQWGNSDTLQVGDQVFAAGNPFGLGLSLSSGIVSALNRDIKNSPYDDLIQTDATDQSRQFRRPVVRHARQGNRSELGDYLSDRWIGRFGLCRTVQHRAFRGGSVADLWVGSPELDWCKAVADDARDCGLQGMARPEGSIVSWVLPSGPAHKAGLKSVMWSCGLTAK